ncbi:hypothetical protein LEP1GSC198_2960 [Leptospira kirschneri str. JB]|nr:hypothetical protein LEP1GSC198_2960 [Leptospira kirschneri str. JB]
MRTLGENFFGCFSLEVCQKLKKKEYFFVYSRFLNFLNS